MSRNTSLTTMVVAGLVCNIVAADAHDSWISRGGYRNPAGEWCCGAIDCEAHDEVATTGAGWVVGGTEFIPYSEAAPSPDGKLWICRRPDKSRRCVFAPPPNS
jgi:hypothetical protein